MSNDAQDAEPDYYKLVLDKGKHGFDELPYFEAESFRQLNILMPGEEKLFNFGYRYCLPVKYRGPPTCCNLFRQKISAR